MCFTVCTRPRAELAAVPGVTSQGGCRCLCYPYQLLCIGSTSSSNVVWGLQLHSSVSKKSLQDLANSTESADGVFEGYHTYVGKKPF